jgi:hypothetical protein
MNIIFGDNVADLARKKYTVLELDTFLFEQKDITATAYAVVEQVPLLEIANLERFTDLHKNLMQEYRKRNWKYCEDAIEHLRGKWSGDLDTFYTELHDRVQTLKTQSLPDNWAGLVPRSE